MVVPELDMTPEESEAQYRKYIQEAKDARERQKETIEWDLTLPCDEELVPYNPPQFDTAFLF